MIKLHQRRTLPLEDAGQKIQRLKSIKCGSENAKLEYARPNNSDEKIH